MLAWILCKCFAVICGTILLVVTWRKARKRDSKEGHSLSVPYILLYLNWIFLIWRSGTPFQVWDRHIAAGQNVRAF